MCWKIYIVIKIFVCICPKEYLFPSPKFLRVTVSSTFKYTIQKAKVRSLDRRLNSPTAILLHIPRCIIHPELRNLRRPIPIPLTLAFVDPPRCSTLVYNSVYRGTWPSKRGSSLLRSGFPAPSPPSFFVSSRENRGEGQTSKAIRAPRGFSGLMEMRARRIRSEGRKSKKSWPLLPRLSPLKGPRGASPRSSPPSSRLGLFFWSPAGGYGFNNWGGNRGRNPKKVFSEVCVSSYRGEISSLPFFFCGDISLEFGILLLIRFLYGLYECSLWVDKRYSNCFSCFLLFWVYF